MRSASTGTVRLLRPAEAAAILGVHRKTLDLILASGDLEFVWVGGGRRIAQSAVQDYIARHTSTGRRRSRRSSAENAEVATCQA